MKNNKNILRRGTLLCILMFLLIPLLSSPVMAAATINTTATTTMTGAGPTALASVPGPWVFPDVGIRTATFVCTFSFSDTLGNPAGSDHQATLTVQKTSTPGAILTASAAPPPGIWLSMGFAIGSFQIVDTYTAGQVPVTWSITLNVTCTDLSTNPPNMVFSVFSSFLTIV